MSDRLRFDIDGYARQAPTFTQASQDVRAAVDTLQHAIQSEGQCWGDDDPGKAFANGKSNDGYVSDLEEGLRHLAGLPGLLEQVGLNIVTTAKALQAQDGTTAQSLNQATKH